MESIIALFCSCSHLGRGAQAAAAAGSSIEFICGGLLRRVQD